MVAASQAMEDAGLTEIPEAESDRYGVAIGSGIGGIVTIEKTHETLMKKRPRRVLRSSFREVSSI